MRFLKNLKWDSDFINLEFKVLKKQMGFIEAEENRKSISFKTYICKKSF